MNYYIKNHNNKTQGKLRNLHSKQPKAFWKLINKLDNKKVDDEIKIHQLEWSQYDLELSYNTDWN